MKFNHRWCWLTVAILSGMATAASAQTTGLGNRSAHIYAPSGLNSNEPEVTDAEMDRLTQLMARMARDGRARYIGFEGSGDEGEGFFCAEMGYQLPDQELTRSFTPEFLQVSRKLEVTPRRACQFNANIAKDHGSHALKVNFPAANYQEVIGKLNKLGGDEFEQRDLNRYLQNPDGEACFEVNFMRFDPDSVTDGSLGEGTFWERRDVMIKRYLDGFAQVVQKTDARFKTSLAINCSTIRRAQLVSFAMPQQAEAVNRLNQAYDAPLLKRMREAGFWLTRFDYDRTLDDRVKGWLLCNGYPDGCEAAATQLKEQFADITPGITVNTNGVTFGFLLPNGDEWTLGATEPWFYLKPEWLRTAEPEAIMKLKDYIGDSRARGDDLEVAPDLRRLLDQAGIQLLKVENQRVFGAYLCGNNSECGWMNERLKAIGAQNPKSWSF